MSNLYFNEESDYSEENTSVNENFDFTTLHFSLSLNRKKTSGKCHEKEANLFTLQLPIY